ncbi:uncharacterized protein PG998_010331 [Apiospora kogelbergensis]|uniref:uncharacterized protein n=1 Tax=Apiospora kogelbergensis TaxID=1337665 RepID=UPI003130AEB5
MSQSGSETNAWLYSESSTGRYLGSLRVSVRSVRRMDYWEAMGVAREEFTDVIQPKLIYYLRENSSEISTSTCMLNLSLFMMGKSQLKTKPTIMFVSEDKKVRKEALNLAKQSDILLEYPGFALGECRLIAEFAGQRQIGYHDEEITSPSGSETDLVELFTDSPFLEDGARLCAKSKGRPDRFATVGGFLRHNGAHLGLTVGHILCSEPTADLHESDKCEDDCEIIGLDDSDEDSEDEEDRCIEFVNSTSMASDSPDALPKRGFSDIASVSSFDMEYGPEYFSSSLARVEDDTKPDIDQLSDLPVSHVRKFTIKAGDILFSSQALDYCVFATGLERWFWPTTMIDPVCLDVSLEDRPLATEISVLKERDGEIRGYMKPFSYYCRFPSTSDFQEVFVAQLNSPLVTGDCGSWVYNTQTNKLFGHVVAASVNNTVITIMPATHVFMDISAQLTPKPTQKAEHDMIIQPSSEFDPRNIFPRDVLALLEKAGIVVLFVSVIWRSISSYFNP